MTTLFLDMPEDRNHLPVWLERVLLSPDLPRLVTELKVIHGVPAQQLSLMDAMSGYSQTVLESGLVSLPPPVLSRLLRQPDLLPKLRDWVLESGGPYWDSIEATDDLSSSTQRIVEHVRKSMASKTLMADRRRSLTKGVLLFLAMAASVAIFLVWHRYEVNKISQILAKTYEDNEQLRLDNDFLQQRLTPEVVFDSKTDTIIEELKKTEHNKSPEVATNSKAERVGKLPGPDLIQSPGLIASPGTRIGGYLGSAGSIITRRQPSRIGILPPKATDQAAPGWGFARREDLATLEGDHAKLTKLSGLALEWGKKQPQNSLELAKRLLEFRQGCSGLLLNPPPLTKPQQVWFAARCGDWASSIEQQLHALESGADFRKTLENANSLSVSIAKELTDRAKAPSNSG